MEKTLTPAVVEVINNINRREQIERERREREQARFAAWCARYGFDPESASAQANYAEHQLGL